MKQKSIDKSIRSVVISAIITICIRISVILVGIRFLYQNEVGTLLAIFIWIVVGGSAVTMLFMPYLTWVRMKELKEGELYEAGKY